MLFKAKFEEGSTSQRGEINGLLETLEYAVEHSSSDEDIIIITDSMYLRNTVMCDWSKKWEDAGWVGSTGEVKNSDLWRSVNAHLRTLEGRVFVEWIKGHLISYTPGNIKYAMLEDKTGIELYTRIVSVANRPADINRIVADIDRVRTSHDFQVPPRVVGLEWAIANTMADCLAGYLMELLDVKVL